MADTSTQAVARCFYYPESRVIYAPEGTTGLFSLLFSPPLASGNMATATRWTMLITLIVFNDLIILKHAMDEAIERTTSF